MQILSKKVFTLYSLAMQQLSKQDHYDFGLRSLTSLLRYAGRKRRTVNNVPDEEVNPHSKLVPSWFTAITLLLSNLFSLPGGFDGNERHEHCQAHKH